MNRYLIHFLGIIYMISSACNAQQQASSVDATTTSLFTWDNFDEKILTYEPSQRKGVLTKDYERGMTILRETRSNTKTTTPIT